MDGGSEVQMGWREKGREGGRDARAPTMLTRSIVFRPTISDEAPINGAAMN